MKRACLGCGHLVTGRCTTCERERSRKRGTRQQQGYGPDYQRARRQVLASGDPCWCCGAPATTADHYPPKAQAGDHLHLLPACHPCNSGHCAARRGADPQLTRCPRQRQ